jgi:GH25 family lysozyme M1 (1,4-beta-N-acetylmuramidase)
VSKGIDVFEKYQHTIDWAKVSGAGVRNVFVKLSNGSRLASPAGDHYVNGARLVGIAVGGYAYVLAGDPSAQADVFAAELLRLNALDLAPALDFEDAGLPSGTAARRAFVVVFFGRLKVKIPRLTRVLLYGSGSALAAMDAGTISLPGLEVLIWDAEYGPNNGAEHPVTHYKGAIAVHQYTSVGTVSGVSGNVDLDTINSDITHPVEGDVAVQLNADDIAAIAKAVVNTDEFRALAGRVLALSAGRDVAEWVDGPVGGEESKGGRMARVKIDSLGLQLHGLANTVATMPAGTPTKLTGNATVTVQLSTPAIT